MNKTRKIDGHDRAVIKKGPVLDGTERRDGWVPQKLRLPAHRAFQDPLLIIDAGPPGDREEGWDVEINRGKVLPVPHKSARGHIFFELVIK